jgi:hypothetical protein
VPATRTRQTRNEACMKPGSPHLVAVVDRARIPPAGPVACPSHARPGGKPRAITISHGPSPPRRPGITCPATQQTQPSTLALPHPPRCHMISAETSESRQPLRGRFANLDTPAAAKGAAATRRDGEDLHGVTTTGTAPAVTGPGPTAGPTVALERAWQPGYLGEPLWDRAMSYPRSRLFPRF